MACLHDGTDDINTQQLFRIHQKRYVLVSSFSLVSIVSVFTMMTTTKIEEERYRTEFVCLCMCVHGAPDDKNGIFCLKCFPSCEM